MIKNVHKESQDTFVCPVCVAFESLGKRRGALLFLILAGALALRLVHISSQSLWLDESLGILFSQSPKQEFFPLLRLDVHPPLYFMILRAVLFLGANPLILRLVSVVFGMAGLGVFYLALSSETDKESLVLTLFFLALSPLAVHYSQEIRMYGLLFLLTNLTLWSLLRFIKKPELQPFILFCLFSVLSIYTHYFAGVFVLGCLVFLAWERIRDEKSFFKGIFDSFLTAVLILVLYLPWLGTFFSHLFSSSLEGMHAQSHFRHVALTLTEYFTQLFGGVIPWVPLEKDLIVYTHPSYLGSLGWILFSLFILALFIYGLSVLRKERRIFRLVVSILGTGMILTLLHLAMQGRFYSRCFIIFLPLVFYVLARGIAALNLRILKMAALIYLSLCLLVPTLFYLSIDIRDVSLPLSRYLKETIAPQDLIIHTSKFSYFPLKIYIPDSRQYLVQTPLLLKQERILAGHDLVSCSDALPSAKRIWLVIEYWGKPFRWDKVEFWTRSWLGPGWNVAIPSSYSMGVKNCTLVKCERQ